MRARRATLALGLAAVLTAALGACGSGPTNEPAQSAPPSESGTLTVWLQVDAQQGWPQLVEAATTEFKVEHPNVEVDVQYQQWAQHLTKLDATLAGKNTPDVVEMGNSETTKYMASGAFVDLTEKKSTFENSDTWLPGLTESCTYEGRLYCVPYYAGARAVIYRTDMFKAAGIAAPPTTLDELDAAAAKLNAEYGKDKGFSAFYFPGKYWYAAMPWVYDAGGAIAKNDGGAWAGTLDSAEARSGLTRLKAFVETNSKADKTGDEAKQDQAFAQGKVAMIYANGWEWGVITDPKQGDPELADKLGAFPMPGTTAETSMPTFLGGSDLAIPAKSANPDLAADWIAAFTSAKSSTALAKDGKVIANTTTLADVNADNPQLAPFAEAAKNSWFVPTAPGWANVEAANVLPDMLVGIFTGKASVDEATTAATEAITQTLGEGS